MKNDDEEMNKKLLEEKKYLEEEKMSAVNSSELGGNVPLEMTAEELQSQEFVDQLENELNEGEGEPVEGKEMSEEQKAKYLQMRKKMQQFSMRLAEHMKNPKEGDGGKFTIEKPSSQHLYCVFDMWRSRGKRNDKYFLNLQLTECEIPVQQIKKLFLLTPSVKLTVNGVEVDNPGVLKIEGDKFYQGQDHYMTIFANGGRYYYEGQVVNCVPHGQGQVHCDVRSREGYVYKGQFVFGKMEGKGLLQSNKGSVYVGQFKDNLKDGQGEEQIFGYRKKKATKPGEQPVPKRKSLYKGSFKNGLRDGQGTEETSHGTYDGTWKEGFKEGDGQMIYKNGDNYKGNWVKDQFSGQGEYVENENCKYSGQFLNGKYHGNGVMEYKNGDKYEGEFQYGKKHGSGVYNYEDGDYYDGEWRNDSAEGHGTSMMGADFYDGQFKNGMKHGEGQLTNEQGDITRGIWQNNELMKTLQINGEVVQDD